MLHFLDVNVIKCSSTKIVCLLESVKDVKLRMCFASTTFHSRILVTNHAVDNCELYLSVRLWM